jgi:hypothetical protein
MLELGRSVDLTTVSQFYVSRASTTGGDESCYLCIDHEFLLTVAMRVAFSSVCLIELQDLPLPASFSGRGVYSLLPPPSYDDVDHLFELDTVTGFGAFRPPLS